MSALSNTAASPAPTERSSLARASGVLWRNAGDDVLALGRHAHEAVLLAGPAATLWRLLDEPLTGTEVLNQLASLYEVSTSLIESDVTVTISALIGNGVVVEVEP